MKKKTISAIITAAAIFISCSGIAIAQPNETVKATLSPQFTIVVDSVERDFYNADGDEVFPIVYNGTTYLPLRAIGELMDKNVNWDQSTLTITLSGTRNDSTVTGEKNDNAEKEEISAEVRYDFTIVVDGAVQSFKDANGSAVYPILYEGSTYLPIRAIGTLMGKSVSWDADTQTVYIGTDSETIVTDADSFNSGTVTDADSFNSGMPERQDGDKKGNYENNQQIPFENNQQIPPENQQTNRPDGNGGKDVIPEQYEAGITLEEAKAAALEDAGLDADDVTFTKAKLDYDDGALVYDIEFRYGTTEYEYEINASTGAVVSYDVDIDD
ncbi:MAG: PepSY domain-containing protein [Firmicutes bacterium]|nr:PepSY domain-containing protein [Bacillota bacterium]